MNMALDEALLENVAAGESPPLLRLYGWSPPAVTIGYFQKGHQAVNLAVCQEYGYDVVRRTTGGRAVLHDQEVTYAVIAPYHSQTFPGSVMENYHVIGQGLRNAVRSFGIAAELAAGRQKNPPGADSIHNVCFFSPAYSELVHAGCKLAGSAQRRVGDTFLQHGSIPLHIDPVILFRVLTSNDALDPQQGAKLLASRVGWLNRWSASPLSRLEVEEALIRHLGESLDIRWQVEEPTAQEWSRAENLQRDKFSRPDWTFRPE